MKRLSRSDLLANGGKGAALLAAGSVFGGLVPQASAAVPDQDLAYARLLVGVELLALDFYAKAIASKQFEGGALHELRRARSNEHQHYESYAAILTKAGQIPATAEDIDFSYPKASFDSRGSITKLGIRLESVALGAYLGAVEGFATNDYKALAARVAANESQHLSVFSGWVGGRRVGPPLAASWSINRVSDALDAYTS